MVLEPAAQPHKGLPSPYDGAKAMEDPFVRHRLVEADAAIRGLHARLAANFAEMDALIDAGAFFPPELQAKNKWDAQWIAKGAQKAFLEREVGGHAAAEREALHQAQVRRKRARPPRADRPGVARRVDRLHRVRRRIEPVQQIIR